jgi:antitoxin component HigA of HigAB toxin-antitoxin module
MSQPRTPTPISDLLRSTIARSGKPLMAIERETGVSRGSIMRFLRRRQFLRLDMADRLAQHFGLVLVKKDR